MGIIPEQSVFIHINQCAGTSIKTALNLNLDVPECLQSKKFKYTARYWEYLFKYTFIRNPFDRLNSLYNRLRSKNSYSIVTKGISFQEWFELAIVDQEFPYYHNKMYIKPCYNWLVGDTGRIEVDFIGKVERLEKDFAELCDFFSIKTQLPKLKVSYEEHYFDHDMREVVLDMYKKDFENWYQDYRYNDSIT